jgi:site-specific recombinase XerD
MTSRTLGAYLLKFFKAHLLKTKGLSINTARSYRDTWKLLLTFLRGECAKRIEELQPDDVTKDRVLHFLDHLEEARHNTIRTRNQRLSAIKSFARFLGEEDPLFLHLSDQLIRISEKKRPKSATRHIDMALFEKLASTLPSTGLFANRDRAAILFLYDSGARAEEAVGASVQDLNIRTGMIRLFGKGRKERVVKLIPRTVELLRREMEIRGTTHNETAPLFVSQRGGRLTRIGLYRMVRRRVREWEACSVEAKRLRVSPHVFRHTMAMHRLASGTDLATLQEELGHAHLSTTQHYAKLQLSGKSGVIHQGDVDSDGPDSGDLQRWRTDENLLAQLESL